MLSTIRTLVLRSLLRGIQHQWLSAISTPDGPISELQHHDTHAPYATRGMTNQMVFRPDHVVWPNSAGSWFSGPFSREQLMEYNQNGYLMLEGFFSKDEVKEMLKNNQQHSGEVQPRNLRSGSRHHCHGDVTHGNRRWRTQNKVSNLFLLTLFRFQPEQN